MNESSSSVATMPVVSSIMVKLPAGSIKDFPAGTTALDVANSISPRLVAASVVAKVRPMHAQQVSPSSGNGTAKDVETEAEMYAGNDPTAERLVDLGAPLNEDVELQLLR